MSSPIRPAGRLTIAGRVTAMILDQMKPVYGRHILRQLADPEPPPAAVEATSAAG